MSSIAVLAFDDPWESNHGGTLRTQAFVTSLSQMGHDVTCVYAGAPGPTSESRDGVTLIGVQSRPLGERIRRPWIGRTKRALLPLPTIRGGYIPELAAALRSAGPYDVLLVQQLRGVQYLDATPGAVLWLDQTDLWSDFLESESAMRTGLTRITARAQQRFFKRLESRYGDRASHLSAAGFGDAARMSHRTARHVAWLPTPATQITGAVIRTAGDSRPTAGLFANFSYWPNRAAYDVLAEHWAGPLREQGWSVVVAGLASQDLPSRPGIEVWGPMPSAEAFYRKVDLCLSPLTLGGGVKVKVLEALMAGRPVAATAESLDGFPADVVPGALRTDVRKPSFPGPDEVHRIELLRPSARLAFSIDGFSATIAEVLR